MIRTATMFLLGLVAMTNAAAAQSYSPKAGQRHAEMVLPRIDTGGAVSLSQFRGKKVLLVHFASW